MSNNIIDAFMDYSKGKIVYTLETAFLGFVGDEVEITGTTAQRIEYCAVDAMLKTTTSPRYDAMKTKSHNIDALITKCPSC